MSSRTTSTRMNNVEKWCLVIVLNLVAVYIATAIFKFLFGF
jgi:hypothetical protein